jgi:hypothetical protein
MAICGCGSPALCCQPAVAGGVIYADLWGELSTHWPHRLFTQSSPVCKSLLQAFLFPSAPWVVTLHQLSQACLFFYSSCGKWIFPHFLWSFPPSTTLTFFPTPGCWERATAPSLSDQAPLVYLQFQEGFPPLWCSRLPTLFALVFIVLIAYYSVSLFSPGGGHSVQGAMLIWPMFVYGSTMYHLAHLVVCVFPSHLGMGNWRQPRGPPVFSIQCEVEMLCTG